jgi:hypothetical protein
MPRFTPKPPKGGFNTRRRLFIPIAIGTFRGFGSKRGTLEEVILKVSL